MVIDCCSQERSYSTFYGLVSERFCKLNRVWNESFERAFETYYDTIHRYETNRLRNIARLFGHLHANDAISWTVLQVIKMNEDDTTSSNRILSRSWCRKSQRTWVYLLSVNILQTPRSRHFVLACSRWIIQKIRGSLSITFHEYRTRCPYWRHARASQGELSIQRFVLCQSWRFAS